MSSNTHLFTSEWVSPGHSDKLLDSIAEAIVDYAIDADPKSRVAVDGLVKNNRLFLAGEITCPVEIPFEKIVKDTIKNIGYTPDKVPGFNHENVQVETIFTMQSPDINQGVDKESGEVNSGDQGIMFGGAVNEAPDYTPHSYYLAKEIGCKLFNCRFDIDWMKPDIKTQVTIKYEDGVPSEVVDIVCAVSHKENISQEEIQSTVKDIVVKFLSDYCVKYNLKYDNINWHINTTGKFVICGPESDSGEVGRKIVVDQAGAMNPVGGGALCVAANTKVSTDRGTIPIQDVTTGDQVALGYNLYSVLRVVNSGIKDSFVIKTKSGHSVTTSGDHQFKVMNDSGFSFVEAKDLQVGDVLAIDTTGCFGDMNIDDAYIIGSILGDGYLAKNDNSIRICVPEFDDAEYLRCEFDRVFGSKWKVYTKQDTELNVPVKVYFYCNKEYRQRLETMGMSSCGAYNKIIPAVFNYANKQSISKLLRGLFDTDGSISLCTKSHKPNVKIKFVSSSKSLVEDVVRYLSLFGINTTTYFATNKQGTLISHVQIRGIESLIRFRDEIGFGISRKQEMLDLIESSYTQTHDRTLVYGVDHLLNDLYQTDAEFRLFLRENNLDSARKTFTKSGESQKRGEVVCRDNIKKILKYPNLPDNLRLSLETSLNYYYTKIVEIYESDPVEMYDITVDKVHQFVANGIVTHNCGKCPSKVDRTAVYQARRAAKWLVANRVCDKCEIQVSYSIGESKPISVYVNTFGTNHRSHNEINKVVNALFSFAPSQMIVDLQLCDKNRPFRYLYCGMYGHIGDSPAFGDIRTWEEIPTIDFDEALLIANSN